MQNLPAGGRYTKENLLQQCLADPEKADALIDELENLDGNVGAVSQAITEVSSNHSRLEALLTFSVYWDFMPKQGYFITQVHLRQASSKGFSLRHHAAF